MPRSLFLKNAYSYMAPVTGEGEDGGSAPAPAATTTTAPEGQSSEGESEGKAGDSQTEAEKALQKEKESLLKEVMKKKGAITELQDKLKAFDGIDPEQIKALLAKDIEAKAASEAAEKKSLEEKGEWNRLKTMMVEQHDKTLSTKDAQIAEMKSLLADQAHAIEELTVGSAFNSSAFIGDELTLTPSKARIIYGSNFEVVDGQVVAFDKPVGAKERTPLVDERGNNLGFESAIRKLVDLDPDREALIRARVKPGSGSKPPATGATPASSKGKTGMERISAGLSGLMQQK